MLWYSTSKLIKWPRHNMGPLSIEPAALLCLSVEMIVKSRAVKSQKHHQSWLKPCSKVCRHPNFEAPSDAFLDVCMTRQKPEGSRSPEDF